LLGIHSATQSRQPTVEVAAFTGDDGCNEQEDKEMVTAIDLLRVEKGKINSVAQALADMEGIAEVYSVGGRFDLVAIIRTKDNERLAELVTEHMLKTEGVLDSETLIAFQAYSRHDLERMFAIGLD